MFIQPEKEVLKPFESKMTKGTEVGITDEQKLVTALVEKDYDAISNFLGNPITWALEASECCGNMDKDEAIKRVRQKLEAQQYQFNQESPTIVSMRGYFKKYPEFDICSQSNVIGVMDDHALTFCIKSGRVQMIREASTLREYGIVATEAKDEAADWKTYRDEKSGLEFKYPPNFKLNENTAARASYGLYDSFSPLLLSLQIGDNIKIALGRRSCNQIGQSAIRNATYLLGQKIKDLSINGFNGALFQRGCYECYDGDSRLETEGVVVGVCNTTENSCIVISTEDKREQFERAKGFFLNEFLPTVKLNRNFDNISCVESKG